MANVKLVFSGTTESETSEHSLETFLNAQNEIIIIIDDGVYYPKCICLDKQTAIRFHKELKKQISYFREEGKDGQY